MPLALSPAARRRARCGRCLVLAGLVLGLAWPATAQNMFRGDPAHRATYVSEGPATFSQVKWTLKTGGPVVSSPVIAQSRLFVGSDDKAVHAVELATGAEAWTFVTGGFVRSTPAVGEGAVYFGSYDGFFYALDAGSGALRWKFEVAGEQKFAAKGLHGSRPRAQLIPDAWDCFLSSPVVADGRVYFGSGDGNVYALDAQSGKLVWKFATNGVVHSSPALADGMIYVGSFDTFLYALDAATGELKWKFKTGEDPVNHNQEGIPSSPCVADGVVYFGCRDFHLYAVDAKTGQEKWKHKITWVIATPTVRDGLVYASTSIPAFFFAVDAKTGQEAFRVDVKMPAFSSPTLAGGMAYGGTFGGRLYAIDLVARKVAWEFTTAAAKENARRALAADGTFNPEVMFRSDFFEAMFQAVDMLFGIGAIVSSPVVDHGVVYVGSADGNVYALE